MPGTASEGVLGTASDACEPGTASEEGLPGRIVTRMKFLKN